MIICFDFLTMATRDSFDQYQFLIALTHFPFLLVSLNQPLSESLHHLTTSLPFSPAFDVLPTSGLGPTSVSTKIRAVTARL